MALTHGGLARQKSELPPLHLQQVLIHDYCPTEIWLQWIYSGALVKATTKRHQGQLLAGQRQHQHNLRPRTTGERWQSGAHPQVNSSREWILSFSAGGSAPTPPTSRHRSESQLRHPSAGLHSNNQGGDSGVDKAVITTVPKGGPTQYPGQALINTTPIKVPVKGIMAQASGQNSHTRAGGVGCGGGQIPEAREAIILKLAGKRPQPQKFHKIRWQRNMLQIRE